MSRTAHPRGRTARNRHAGRDDLKDEARVVRRCAERDGLHALLGDPEADVVLPTAQRHAGDPWNWS